MKVRHARAFVHFCCEGSLYFELLVQYSRLNWIAGMRSTKPIPGVIELELHVLCTSAFIVSQLYAYLLMLIRVEHCEFGEANSPAKQVRIV